MEYKRNEETGKVEVWNGDKKVGEAVTLNDIISEVEVPVDDAVER